MKTNSKNISFESRDAVERLHFYQKDTNYLKTIKNNSHKIKSTKLDSRNAWAIINRPCSRGISKNILSNNPHNIKPENKSITKQKCRGEHSSSVFEGILKKQTETKIKQAGITLIALVITIIILIILAGVTINLTLKQNGILGQTQTARVLTKIAEAEEAAKLIDIDKQIDNIGKTVPISEIAEELRKKGYEIEIVIAQGNTVTGISIEKELYKMPINSDINIDVKQEGNTEGNEYYLKVEGKYYKIKRTEKGIEIERRESTIGGTSEENELTVDVIEGSNITAQVEGNTIKITSQDTAGEAKIKISYGEEYNIQCTIKVEKKPNQTSTATNKSEYSTEYGDIDIIWLKNDTNEVASTPNGPNLYNNSMKLVKWEETANGWNETAREVAEGEKGYEYKAGTGKEDNQSSMWANAKNTVDGEDSYFVWIPRYAYRITYYEDEAKTKVTGYYDGLGMWDANTGELNYELDLGIETVEYEGESYIVHPAFMKDIGKKDKEGKLLEDYARGGWKENQTGIWVAKYEMSRTNASASSEGSGEKFKSVPRVQSARSITIGNMYEYGLKYDEAKESHMMKNSEWGAVAYLTHSKYGRNGHEIDINNSSTFITGNGGGAVGGSVNYQNGELHRYNTKLGAKASTTGNIYGVYDVSGGSYEYTAGYDRLGDQSCLNYGGEMVNGTKTSSKYVTVYENVTGKTSNVTIQKVSKIGDGIKEVKRRNSNSTWFSDSSNIVYSSFPFLYRGGYSHNGALAGVFSAAHYHGVAYIYVSFRTVLGSVEL